MGLRGVGVIFDCLQSGSGVTSRSLPSHTTGHAGPHPAVRLNIGQRRPADNYGSPSCSHNRFGNAMLSAGLRLGYPQRASLVSDSGSSCLRCRRRLPSDPTSRWQPLPEMDAFAHHDAYKTFASCTMAQLGSQAGLPPPGSPHHRTCRSASGGSSSTRQSAMLLKQAD